MKKSLVRYSPAARKALLCLDGVLAKRIITKIDFFASAANPLESAKSLSGPLAGFYRYRVGDYRVIFTFDTHGTVNILDVLKIQHRKDVYR
jgi:mRNA interferase RelE/StbE